MNRSEDCALLFKAISAAQGEFTTVEKNAKNPHFNSKFAPLDSIIEMIRPILPKHGLAAIQFTDIPESGNGIIIETVLTHESGQFISGRLFMPAVKQDPQGYGSALTYGKRYGLAAALGIVSDEDVDGNQPEGAERQTKAQQKAQQTTKSAAQHIELTEAQAKYFPRVKAALDTLHGSDVTAKKKTIKKLTHLPAKGDWPEKQGIEDYRKLDGKPLEIFAHAVEKLAKDKEPVVCNECRQPVDNHSPSCPNAEPPQ